MIGMVLAAGAGRRLRPHTDRLPKTLLPVAGKTTILDIALANLASVGLDRATLVVGFAARAVEERLVELEARHNLDLHLVHNDKAEVWNNAYSLWCGLSTVDEAVMLINGDTLHPSSVERTLLRSRGPGIVLAVDAAKPLADEEMKILVGADRCLSRISKELEPGAAQGEYIGVSLIEAHALHPLRAALETSFRRDPNLYYEDAFQEMVDRGARIGTAAISADTRWVEVDTQDDLDRARELACLY